MSEFKGKLHETVVKFPCTDIWNDSCAQDDLEYAIERGAVGATTNPVIVKDVLKKEMPIWAPRIRELNEQMPEATEDDIAWALIEEIAAQRSKLLLPAFEKFEGKKGRLSIQTNAKNYRNSKKMTEQAIHFNTLGPNMQVKMATSKAGIQSFEDATYAGVSINATISFTVAQAVAVAEAVERGLKRREAEGLDTSHMSPVCTIMIGRVDDYIKYVASKDGTIVDPTYLEWAGVAVFKEAYRIYKERGYRTRLLTAAYRNHFHWSEFIGGDCCMTIPHAWQKRFNESDVTVEERMSHPVDPKIVDTLLTHFPEFVKAYREDAQKPEDFEHYGAFIMTLNGFLAGYDELCGIIRGFMNPTPFA